MKILIVEDNKELAQTIKDELSQLYIIDVCHTAQDAQQHIDENRYDVLIIDLVLPDLSGVALCRNLRKEDIKTPILILTGKTDVSSVVRALNAGADDYLKKPFAFSELFARVKALIRRQAKNLTAEILSAGDLILDLNTKKVTRAGKLINLRKKEYYLLEYMLRNKGVTLTRNMIMEAVWESTSEPEKTNTVNVHMKALRDRIDKDYEHKLITTVPGLGYMLED